MRNVVERINICALKKWGIFGGVLAFETCEASSYDNFCIGRNLHHRFLPRIDTLARLSGALFNAYHGPLDRYGDDDEHHRDFETMCEVNTPQVIQQWALLFVVQRRLHENKIPDLLASEYKHFTKNTFYVEELPRINR